MDSPSRPVDRSGFHVAIICALTRESNAVDLLFDEIHDTGHTGYGRAAGDNNTYTTGRVGNHAVVLLVLPNMGMEAAAAASAHMLSSFPNIKLGLVVGICGGIPRIGGEEAFLGDVVISRSIVNYGFGRQYPDKFVVKSSVEDSLARASKDVRGLLNLFDREHDLEALRSKAMANLSRLQTTAVERKRRAKYTTPPGDTDRLFPPDYQHRHRDQTCGACTPFAALSGYFCEEAPKLSCDVAGCDVSPHKLRQNRQQHRPAELVPQIFTGKVASGNAVIKSGQHRDTIAEEHGIIAFEMEGAGAWDEIPCIVVKGICDYADSHKNKHWQDFAAATAASVAVAILEKYEVAGAATGATAAATSARGGLSAPPLPEQAQNTATHNYHNHSVSGPNLQGNQISGGTFNFGERPETPPQPFAAIPFSRDPDFVNRGDILDRLDQRCSEPASRAALVGLGGIGKSQLAIEFAHRIAEGTTKRWVFWIHASTQARVRESFKAIADTAKLPGRDKPNADIPQLVYNWLFSERAGKWTIILDSADDKDVFYPESSDGEGKPLASYLPQSRNGSILVTTRDGDLGSRLTGGHKNIIRVGPMELEDALVLLGRKLGPISDTDTAKRLVQALDRVPLAIGQAAAYIHERRPRTSIGEYLAEFEKSERKRTKLLAHDAGDLRRDGWSSSAILNTWRISFDYISDKRPSAADLLSLMSFFDQQGIAPSLLKPTSAKDFPRADLPDASEDSGSESTSSSSDEPDGGFEDDVAVLRNFGLVTAKEDEDALEMHALVQLSTRWWLEENRRQDKFKRQFLERMSAAFPHKAWDYSNWSTCQKLFAHVEAAVDCRPADDDTEELWAWLMHEGGNYANSQGRYELAERMVGKAQESKRRRLGEDDKGTLSSTLLLAEVLWRRGQWDKAELLQVQVLEARKRVLGKEHPETLINMHNLAVTYTWKGRLKEAESLMAQAVELQKRVLGGGHRHTLISMDILAVIYYDQGRLDKAESLGAQVLEAKKRALGGEHPVTLTSMGRLALTYLRQGRVEEAELLEVQVLETRKRVLGGEHPDTLASMGNLALSYYGQGRLGEAELLEVQVLETKKRVLGGEHPDTLSVMNNLAHTWKGQKRHADALALMKECAEVRRRVLGPEHQYTLDSLEMVAKWSR